MLQDNKQVSAACRLPVDAVAMAPLTARQMQQVFTYLPDLTWFHIVLSNVLNAVVVPI